MAVRLKLGRPNQPNMNAKRNVFLIFSFLAALFALSFFLEWKYWPLWLYEGGLIESFSATSYFVCCILITYLGRYQFIKLRYYFLSIVSLMGLRELGFDKYFNEIGLFNRKFYFSTQISNVEKLIGIIVIILVMWSIFLIVKNHLKGFMLSLKKPQPYIIYSLWAILLIIFSQILDGIDSKLTALGFFVSKALGFRLMALEEILELGIPMMMILAFYSYLSAGNNKQDKIRAH